MEAKNRDELIGFKARSKFFEPNIALDQDKCKKMLELHKNGTKKLTKNDFTAIKEETVNHKEGEFSENLQKAYDEVYEENTDIREIIEEKDIDEYGEELHHELFCKKDADYLTDFENKAAKLKVLSDSTANGVVSAVVQCLFCSEVFARILLTGTFEDDVTSSLKAVAQSFFKKDLEITSNFVIIKKFAESISDTLDVFGEAQSAERVLAEILELIDSESFIRDK